MTSGSPYDPDALDRRDPALIARILPLAERVAARYFRLRWDGAEHVPPGPALFVANHNGGILGPDLFCTLPILWRLLAPARPLYALAHDFAMRQVPPLGWVLQKLGAVRACRDNAARALASGASVLVYPGGDQDAYRHFRRRNEVVILPRIGFVRVAQELGVPIVPVVAAGAHTSALIFTEGKALARLLQMPRWARLDRFPLALALPWGLAPGPWLPYLPLPLPIRVRLLEPMSVAASADPHSVATEVQSRMQRTLAELSG